MMPSHSTNSDRSSQSGRSRDQLRAIRVIELARQQSPVRTPERIGAESMAIVDRRQPAPSRSPWRVVRRRLARIYYSDIDWMAFVGTLFWIGSVAMMSWICWELALWLGAEQWTW